MIKLIPEENSENLKQLCKQNSLEYTPHIHAYVGADGAEGEYCLFSIDGYNMEILALKCDKSDELKTEIFIRSVANYGARRSGYTVKCTDAEAEKVLLTLKFEKQNGAYIGKVPKILQGTCCHE